MKKRIVAFVIAVVMICGMHGSAIATAYSRENETPISVYHDDDLDIDPVDTGDIPRTWSTGSTLEASYTSPYVTSVKSQSPYGTCWAFAFISASEASLIREGLASLGTDEVSEVDLSELHLAYFMSHSVTDPLGGTAGDGFSLTETYTNAFLDEGGSQSYATICVANWYGLVEEAVAPYNSVVAGEQKVLSDDIAYSKDRYHLENSYWIPLADQDTVKNMIKRYGACGASYYDSDTYYNVTNAWYQSEAVATYCPTDEGTNHAITIVGWDDNYSKDKFGTYKPSGDGAWLCKNSWGSNWSEDGYFWISYEDVPLSSGVAFFYDYGMADNYDKNYQYDGGALGVSYKCNYEANIYTAQENEYIRAVGFYTSDSNYDCTVKVYKDCTANNPTSGTLLTTVEANQLYAGFHTVDLGDKYLLKEGEKFSVVVYEKATDGEDTWISVDSSYSQDGIWCSNTSIAEEGQSFISSDAAYWQDVSVDNRNCRIKAYTDRIPVSDLEIDQAERIMYVGEEESLQVSVIPQYASNANVTWSSGDDTIATIDEEGVVTAKKAGQVVISCISDDDNTIQAQCTVKVKQWVDEVRLDWKSKEMMKDEKLQLAARILPSDATDQGVSWSSDNVNVAMVSERGQVTAVGYGTATITCTATDQNVKSATCTVTVYEKINDISLNYTEITMEEGQNIQLQVTTNPALNRTKGVYWLSSNPNVVDVDENGLLTAKAFGEKVVISCVAKDGSGIKATCVVTVENSVVVHEKGAILKDSTTNAEYKVINGGAIGGTVQFAKGTNCSGAITIPDTITIDEVTYKVTTIASNAFKGNKKVTKVVIKDNVTSIGNKAFYGCSNLTTVTIGKSVTTVGENAFYNCKKLKTVSIGKNVKTIGNKAFYQCSKLNKVIIPSKVTKIGKQAFYKCKALKSITIKTSKLTKKKVGSKAFKGIHSKATIKVPKKKLQSYKSILKASGIGNKVKVKKN